MKLKLLFLASLAFMACICFWELQSTSRLEQALRQAGENRAQLEMVLTHYENDSLKLLAAKFLIENMPGHYSYLDDSINAYYDRIDSALLMETSLVAEMKMLDSISKQESDKKYEKVFDLEIMTADYLIKNIDTSFELWLEGEWARHLSFDEFCEYILPYKVIELQPLDDWKNYLRGRYASELPNMHNCDSYKQSAFRAAYAVNKELKDSLQTSIFYHSLLPVNRLETKLRMQYGSCADYNYIAAAVLKSEGIPVMKDFTPQWPFRSLGHDWCVVLSNNGKNVMFGGADTNPGDAHNPDAKMAKVYRQTYSINLELEKMLRVERVVPNEFKQIHIKDVTAEYMRTEDVEVKIDPRLNLKNEYAYLAVFDNKRWTPICWGAIKGNSAFFKNIGRGIVYLPVYYTDKGVVPLSSPFELTPLGEIRTIIADTTLRETIELSRKYPLFTRVYTKTDRVVGGKIQASNRADFKDCITLHEITELGIQSREVSIHSSGTKYRYWRYLSPPHGFCNIAELFFFEKDAEKASIGKVIGTKGSYKESKRHTKEKVFDNNPLTFFDAPEDVLDAWVGLDFGEPISVDRVIYVPRGDGNSIFLGDEYELFYWDTLSGWLSLGKQVAKSAVLVYDRVPSKGLYLLRNLTIGKDERIFTFENGKQIWW